MPRFVVVLDTPAIKSFVFGTDALAEVRGASALLDRLNRVETEKELRRSLPQHGAELDRVVFANGGTGQFLVTAPELRQVEDALADLAFYYREQTGGEVRIVWGVVPWPETEPFKEAVVRAHTQMRLVRETDFASPATALLPLFHECATTSHLPAAVEPFVWGGESLRLSEAARFKREESADERHDKREAAGPWVEWMQRLAGLSPSEWPGREDWARSLRPKDAEAVARARVVREGRRGRAGYVGVIYADGNAMGRLVQELPDPETTAAFSEIVDGSVRAACFAGLEHVCGREIEAVREAARWQQRPQALPADILLLGGDDLLVLLPADAALPFALHATEAFEQRTRARLAQLSGEPRRFFEEKGLLGPKGGMTISCGVALAPAKYPFYLLLELAEALLKSAKTAGSKAPERSDYWAPSFIDFHLIAGAATPELKEVREDDYRVGTEHPRTRRPYRRDDLVKLRQAAERVRQAGIPRSKLQDLSDAALEERPARARQRARELFGRLREGKGRQERQTLWLALRGLGNLTDFPWFEDGSSALADLVEAHDLFPPEGLSQ